MESTSPTASPPHTEGQSARSDSPEARRHSYSDLASSDHRDESRFPSDHSPEPSVDTQPSPDDVNQNLDASSESLEDSDMSGHAHTNEQDLSNDSDESAPENALVVFDWKQFEANYLEMIKTKDAEENAFFAEFQALCEFFSVWADTSSLREVDRGIKRFKTQAAFVQHEEMDLEKRRQHYVKVVDAFKLALRLLA